MTIDRSKVDFILANKCTTISDLCKFAGVSRARFYTIMNSKRITPKTAGKIAKALGVDVTEIIED